MATKRVTYDKLPAILESARADAKNKKMPARVRLLAQRVMVSGERILAETKKRLEAT